MPGPGWAQPILLVVDTRDEGTPLWFYELHEGDNEVYTDVLLAHETEYDEAEFLELVLESRERVLEHFTTDTLSEAIARELAARHGFVVVDDRFLRASVNVSSEEGGTFVTDVEAAASQPAPGDMRSILVDIDREDRRWGDG
jgi:hypothetical protein